MDYMIITDRKKGLLNPDQFHPD